MDRGGKSKTRIFREQPGQPWKPGQPTRKPTTKFDGESLKVFYALVYDVKANREKARKYVETSSEDEIVDTLRDDFVDAFDRSYAASVSGLVIKPSKRGAVVRAWMRIVLGKENFKFVNEENATLAYDANAYLLHVAHDVPIAVCDALAKKAGQPPESKDARTQWALTHAFLKRRGGKAKEAAVNEWLLKNGSSREFIDDYSTFTAGNGISNDVRLNDGVYTLASMTAAEKNVALRIVKMLKSS